MKYLPLVLVLAVAVICTPLSSYLIFAAPSRAASRMVSQPSRVQFAPAEVIPGPGMYPTGIASGDFNNDGIPDLVAVSPTQGGIGVALGKGDGTFGPWISSSSTNAPGLVAVGKFDGVNLDAVVNDDQSGNALLLLGSGDGHSPNSTYIDLSEHHVQGFAIADFNDDGNQDLALTEGTGSVFVFLGNGDGTFRSPTKFSSHGPISTALLSGDFNNDGKLDLAVLNFDEAASIAVLLGNGDGTFNSPIVTPIPRRTSAVSIASGDFNEDGKLDLAAAGYGSDKLLLLLGNGDGTFSGPTLWKGGLGMDSVAVADFNGDGHSDIVVANAVSPASRISVLLGNGDGTFQPRVSFGVKGLGPQQVIVDDFNRDGKPDIATVNIDGSNVSVLLNITPFSTTKPPLHLEGNAVHAKP
jgi:hypothetical protein